jgi:hypothetical protein
MTGPRAIVRGRRSRHHRLLTNGLHGDSALGQMTLSNFRSGSALPFSYCFEYEFAGVTPSQRTPLPDTLVTLVV